MRGPVKCRGCEWHRNTINGLWCMSLNMPVEYKTETPCGGTVTERGEVDYDDKAEKDIIV